MTQQLCRGCLARVEVETLSRMRQDAAEMEGITPVLTPCGLRADVRYTGRDWYDFRCPKCREVAG